MQRHGIADVLLTQVPAGGVRAQPGAASACASMRTFRDTQAALLHLEHRLDDQRRSHCLRGLPRVSSPDKRTAWQAPVAAAMQTCNESRS